MINEIIVAIATTVIIALGALLVRFTRSRLSVTSPQTKAIDALINSVSELVPTVNFLVSVQAPQTDALIALLEVTKGKCNGNVDSALIKTRDSRDRYEKFIQKAAKIEEVAL